ncbi:hypothetical protein MRX96_020257 [Rhipicephalus microplus]
MRICTAPFGILLAPLSSTSSCASGIRTVAVADWANGHGGGTMDAHSSNPFLFFVQTMLAITLIPSSGDTRVNRTGPDATERILDWHIDTQRDNAADLDMRICTAPFGRLLAPLSSTSSCASGIKTVAVADWASGHGGGTMDAHSSNPFLFFVQTVLAITLIPSSGDTRVNRTGPDATERIFDWHIDTQRDNAADLDMRICTAPFGRLLAPLSSTSSCASGIKTVAVADWASGHGGGTMNAHSSNPFLFFVQTVLAITLIPSSGDTRVNRTGPDAT